MLRQAVARRTGTITLCAVLATAFACPNQSKKSAQKPAREAVLDALSAVDAFEDVHQGDSGFAETELAYFSYLAPPEKAESAVVRLAAEMEGLGYRVHEEPVWFDTQGRHVWRGVWRAPTGEQIACALVGHPQEDPPPQLKGGCEVLSAENVQVLDAKNAAHATATPAPPK